LCGSGGSCDGVSVLGGFLMLSSEMAWTKLVFDSGNGRFLQLFLAIKVIYVFSTGGYVM